jgi:hypothetical protein
MAGSRRDGGLTIKTEEFSGFLRTLKDKLGDKTDMRTIVDYEMGRVLNRALALTGKASEEKIQAEWKNARMVNVNGRKVWLTNAKTGRAQRLPDAKWANVQSARATGLARTLAKIGASKASFAAIARKLGQEITVPAYVDNVMIKGGVDRFGEVDRREGSVSYGVAIVNKMNVLNYAPNGRQALFAAFAGRIGFYRTNMAKGVFDSIDKLAQKYKGVLIKPRS